MSLYLQAQQMPEQTKSDKNSLGGAAVALPLSLSISSALEKGAFSDAKQTPIPALTVFGNSRFLR